MRPLHSQELTRDQSLAFFMPFSCGTGAHALQEEGVFIITRKCGANNESNSTYKGGTETMPENGRKDDQFVPDFVKEAEDQIAKGVKLPTQEEVTIKFGKGLAEPFQSKDGREFMRILIPNQDPADKTPWASFVLPAKAVHENQYGKGLWAKIPADGTTVVTKPTLQGRDEKGKNIWQDVKNQVPNRDLKAMVESYKTRAPQAKESEPRESRQRKA